MIDAILYIPSFSVLVSYLDEHHPELLQRDDDGAITQPPVVTGFARTPAAINGDELLVYARLKNDQAAQWRAIPGVQILAEVPFTGRGTTDAVYTQVLDGGDSQAIYDRVYPHAPYTITDPDGGEITVTPPERFGAMAGG